METIKLEAFVNQFPFLRSTRSKRPTLFELNDAVETLTVKVARMDKCILDTIPSQYNWDGSMGCTDDNEIIDFILRDGTVIENAVKQSGTSGSNYAHSSRSDWDGQSVLDAIYEKKVTETLQYVVFYKDKYCRWDQSYDCNYVDITIYKLPKDSSIAELVEARKKEVESEIKEQSNF